MISHDNIKQALKSEWVEHVVPTDAKRVIITLPKNLIGKNVKYINWNGRETIDNGFLFYNSTDKRHQFLRADGGILIGYEGECPEGPNGKMILRSKAVSNYLKKHSDALSNEKNILKTIEYFKTHIFKHGKNVTSWDENAHPDIWSSDVEWLVVNFDDKDVFDENMQIRPVISAVKITSVFDAVYYGPNLVVEGIGTTSDNGSWILAKDKTFNLITDDAFKCAYRKISNKRGKI